MGCLLTIRRQIKIDPLRVNSTFQNSKHFYCITLLFCRTSLYSHDDIWHFTSLRRIKCGKKSTKCFLFSIQGNFQWTENTYKHKLCGIKLGEPSTRPPSCKSPQQPTIYFLKFQQLTCSSNIDNQSRQKTFLVRCWESMLGYWHSISVGSLPPVKINTGLSFLLKQRNQR